MLRSPMPVPQRAITAALGIIRTSLEVVYHLIVGGPRTPSELAWATGLSTAVVTQVVKRLESPGHVATAAGTPQTGARSSSWCGRRPRTRRPSTSPRS